jgi:glycosyltransferase involved in cell wall biosynthesis
MLYYKLLGKKVVLTAHNINAGTRDANDTVFNRMTLRAQYRLADHLFVHTEKMKQDMVEQIGIKSSQITVIPFGINNAVPHTDLTTREAKQRLGIQADEKAILFFGNIAPYKGLEYLVGAFHQIAVRNECYRLIICGRAKDAKYWQTIEKTIRHDVGSGRVLLRADFVPDEETEIYFKAADVVALPYTHIFQSGVLFLGYSFGLPVVASDVGSLREDIVEGETGFVCKPCDAEDLARALEAYFASPLYHQLEARRNQIHNFAAETHSWDTVSRITCSIYRQLLSPAQSPSAEQRLASL